MLTINAEIKSDGKRPDGTYNVKLRFTLDRKMRRQGTSLFATPSDLTKDLRIKQSSPLRREVDCLIHSYLERCAKLQIDLNEYTVEDIIDCQNGELAKSRTIVFIQFSREWIASTDIKGAHNNTTAKTRTLSLYLIPHLMILKYPNKNQHANGLFLRI